MAKYILKRIGYMLIVTIILSFIMYMIYSLIPSNRAHTDALEQIKAERMRIDKMPAEEAEAYKAQIELDYQRKYGTDVDSKVIRYLRWLGVYPLYDGELNGLLQGNFGYSYDYNDDVINVVKTPMKNTIFINVFSTIIALAITLPLGIFCAVRKNSLSDKIMQVMTIIGYSLPTFLIAIVFIWIFCAELGVFPPFGMGTPGAHYVGWEAFVDKMYYLALPLIVMTFCSLGGMTRYVRASMIEALSMDCIRTAKAKGLKDKTVIYSHAWRNALIPVVTLVIGWFLSVFSGSLVIENIFAINGMGRIMVTALRNADYEVVVFMQVFYVVMSLLGNLIIDIAYGFVDPRVRVNK